MKRIWGTLLFLAVLAAAVAGGIAAYRAYNTEKFTVEYFTSPVMPGDLCRMISSTGTVEPEELVNVGAQVGGMVQEFGADANGKQVDFRSPVKAGQVLARIDDSLYRAEVEIAKAQKLQAEAKRKSAEANQIQSNAKYELAKANWDRAQQLYPRGIMAKSDYDSALAEHATAVAAKAVSDASVQESKAQIISAAATLAKSERNLGYCVISSPVDGIIIDRRVNLGQTVNASMNAPSLFLIAKDLKRMQVWVSVNEADIGELLPGLKVRFTVDAFPGRTFLGEVKKVRLNATMSQNVVTYVVEIDTDNSDGTLLPYLTANVKFILAERSGVLSVPNAALRFVPAGIMPPDADPLPPDEKSVWTLDAAGRPAWRRVRIGLNDGSRTEILSGLTAGDAVITGSRTVSSKSTAASAKTASGQSPFLPQPPKRNTKGSKPADAVKK